MQSLPVYLKSHFPAWSHEWLGTFLVAGQVAIIVLIAWMLQRTVRRVIQKAGEIYDLPVQLVKPAIAILRWIIILAALMLVMGRLGVSGTVLWTAFTSFAAVAAVAFFAAWSVLSNLFCAILIFTARPFRVGDHVEILDTAEKPGAKGEVVDISLLYVTLKEAGTAEQPGALLQIPNALVFQRVVRRWKGGLPRELESGQG